MRRPLGQHFLTDTNIIKKIIDCSLLTSDDIVVEIGAGPGTMTRLLAEHVKEVIAIEIDRKFVERLKRLFSRSPHVAVIQANALEFPYNTIKGNFKVVANIPYYITTPLLFRLLEFKNTVPSMTLLLQKEVAQRITALPGSKIYGVLSITAQLYTRPVLKFYVSKGSFSPPPKVDSAVVHFEVHAKPLYKMNNEAFFINMVKTAFSQRRKTIANSLKSFDGIKNALQKAGIDGKLRPEVLSIKEFIKISEALQ